MIILSNQKILATTVVLFGIAINAVAQMEELPPPQAKAPPGPGLPIDNGLILLFAVAIIYGVYKILKRSKKPT